MVSGASLLVTESGAPANAIFDRGAGAFGVRWIANDNWTQGTGTPNAPATDGVTYNSEAALLGSATDASLGVFTNAGENASLSFPLALPPAFVNDVRAGGEVGLYLVAISAGTGFTMNSRSFATASARPVLVVSAAPQPSITSVRVVGTDVVLAGTNGAAGGVCQVLAKARMRRWPSKNGVSREPMY